MLQSWFSAAAVSILPYLRCLCPWCPISPLPCLSTAISIPALICHNHHPASPQTLCHTSMSLLQFSSTFLIFSCIIHRHLYPCYLISAMYPLPLFLSLLNLYRHNPHPTHYIFCHCYCTSYICRRNCCPTVIILRLLLMPTSYLPSSICNAWLDHIGLDCLSLLSFALSFDLLDLVISLKITYHYVPYQLLLECTMTQKLSIN